MPRTNLCIRPADNDTLFFFNYRSDRMREIASIFGLPDKPMEVDVPKNLVRVAVPLRSVLTADRDGSTSAQCRDTTPSSPSRSPSPLRQ